MTNPVVQNFLDHPLTQKALYALKDPIVSMAVGGITLGSLGFGLSYSHYSAKACHIPVAFSEIEKIRDECAATGKEIPPYTRYYALTNDIVMKVFEAKNLSYKVLGTSAKSFGTQLEYKIDPTYRIHALIPEYAAMMPEVCKNTATTPDKFVEIKNDLEPLVEELNHTWDESHHDVTHTEARTSTSTDANGKTTTTTTYVEVYDYTIHSYSYDAKHGKKAAALLNEFKTKHPETTLSETLMVANATKADNEDAIFTSMREKYNNKTPSPEEFIRVANTWATGSNFSQRAPEIISGSNKLKNSIAEMNQATAKGKDHYYTTYSHSDSGPEEYQVHQAIQQQGASVINDVYKIRSGVDYAAKNIPLLNQKAKEFVEVAVHYKKGDADALADEVLDMAQDIYSKNFEGGFDVRPFRWGGVILWTLFATGLGVAGAAGASKLQERRQNKSRYSPW